MKKIFRNRQQGILFGLLCMSTLFCFALLGVRLQLVTFDYSQLNSIENIAHYRGEPTYLFLVWNLFLAWIPYAVALLIPKLYKVFPSRLLCVILLSIWLLFFPNAPYIITDLLHLRNKDIIPMWYDVMLFVSFAWTGCMLGYQSLYEVQLFLEQKINRIFSWIFALTCIPLAGFGVFIGRFQRWNSWDIVTQPRALGYELMHTVLHPFAYGHTLGLAIVLSGFLMIGYLTMLTMVKQ